MDILQDSLFRITKAATICNSPTWLVDELSVPKRTIPLKFRAVTGRGKETFEAVRVHQTNPYPTGGPHPYKGGWRYMRYPDKESMLMVARALANDQTLKNAWAGLPYGGAKGIANIDPNQYSDDELEAITKELVIEMLCANILDPDIDVPGPDYGTNANTMKWMYIQYCRINQLLHRPYPAAVVTGKPIDFNGCPGREDATSRGGLIVHDEIMKEISPSKKIPKIGVQGFGNVGYNLCKLLDDENFWIRGKLIAVCDITSGIYNPHGISFKELSAYYTLNHRFNDCPLGDSITPEEIVSADTFDLFVTAAKEGLINKTTAPKLRTSVLLELGNSAVTEEADQILEQAGTIVIPDVAANPGGVIVSSFEWRMNRGDIYHQVDLHERLNWVHEELSKILKLSIRETIDAQRKFNTNLRMAAYIVALQRLELLLKQKHGYQ